MRRLSLKLINDWLSLLGGHITVLKSEEHGSCMACPRKIPFSVISRKCSVVGQGFHLNESDPLRMSFAKPYPLVSPGLIT